MKYSSKLQWMGGKTNMIAETLIALGLMVNPATDDVSDITEEMLLEAEEMLSEEIQAAQSELKEVDKQIAEVESELVELKDSLGSLEDEITHVEKKMDELEERIKDNEEEIASLEEHIAARETALRERLVAMQKNSTDNTIISILLNSSNFLDAIRQMHLVAIFMDADRNILDEQNADLERLEELQAEVEADKQELQESKQQLSDKRDEQKELKESKQTVLEDLEYDYEQLEAELTLAEDTKAQYEEEMARFLAERAEAERLEMERLEAERSARVDAEMVSQEEPVGVRMFGDSAEDNVADWTVGEMTAYYNGRDRMNGILGITASGFDLNNGILFNGYRILAADRSIPLGTLVEIRLSNGKVYTGVVLDRGGRIVGNKFDIVMRNRREALNFGRQAIRFRIVGRIPV